MSALPRAHALLTALALASAAPTPHDLAPEVKTLSPHGEDAPDSLVKEHSNELAVPLAYTDIAPESSTTSLVANDEALTVKAESVGIRFRGKIWAANEDCVVCGLEWSYSKSGTDRNAKFDCSGTADLVYMQGDKIYVDAGGQKCGLEWSQSITDGQRDAKWDCGGSADPVTIENGKIYAMDNQGKKCGLEWSKSKSSGLERNAVWDCRGGGDPLHIPKFGHFLTSPPVPKASDFSSCIAGDVPGIGCKAYNDVLNEVSSYLPKIAKGCCDELETASVKRDSALHKSLHNAKQAEGGYEWTTRTATTCKTWKTSSGVSGPDGFSPKRFPREGVAIVACQNDPACRGVINRMGKGLMGFFLCEGVEGEEFAEKSTEVSVTHKTSILQRPTLNVVYKTHPMRFCDPDHYLGDDVYATKQQAQAVCETKEDCIGVYDYRCNFRGISGTSFKLCAAESRTNGDFSKVVPKGRGQFKSCVHAKLKVLDGTEYTAKSSCCNVWDNNKNKHISQWDNKKASRKVCAA